MCIIVTEKLPSIQTHTNTHHHRPKHTHTTNTHQHAQSWIHVRTTAIRCFSSVERVYAAKYTRNAAHIRFVHANASMFYWPYNDHYMWYINLQIKSEKKSSISIKIIISRTNFLQKKGYSSSNSQQIQIFRCNNDRLGESKTLMSCRQTTICSQHKLEIKKLPEHPSKISVCSLLPIHTHIQTHTHTQRLFIFV